MRRVEFFYGVGAGKRSETHEVDNDATDNDLHRIAQEIAQEHVDYWWEDVK